MKFEKPHKGIAGWEVTLFGYQIFRFHKKHMATRKAHGLPRWTFKKGE